MTVTTMLLLGWSFLLVNTNQTSYAYHSTGTSVFNGPLTATYVEFDEDICYRVDVQLSYYADLYYNLPTNNTYDWALSVNRIDVDYKAYVAYSGNDFYLFNNDVYVWSDSDYDYINPSNNLLYADSSNPSALNSFEFSLAIDMSNCWTYLTYHNNDDDVFQFNFSTGIPSFEDGYYIQGRALVSSELGWNVTNYIDSVTGNYGSYSQGYADGEAEGFSNGYNYGYGDGWTQALTEFEETNSTVLTIFNGILNIALVPINFFLGIFNFDILGINISQFVGALLTVCCIIIILRVVFQGGSKGSES